MTPSDANLRGAKSAAGPRCFIVAEAGVNHNGSIELALRLVEAAASSGADGVKFQSFSASKVVTAGTGTLAYQKETTGDTDQMEMLRRLELPRSWLPTLIERAIRLGIEFLSTPFDQESADDLVSAGMRCIKIPSGELTNHPFIEYLAGKGLPVILSTGMSTLDEVAEAVDLIRRRQAPIGIDNSIRPALTLLHCTSNYPTDPADVNLRAMITLRDAFAAPVGYSDHTEGVTVSVAAAALGACLIEKHLTLDRGMPGPDHKASIEPAEFAELVRQIRIVELSLGSGVKVPQPSEIPVRQVIRRSIVAARNLGEGDTIEQADVAILRPSGGIEPRHLQKVLGATAKRQIQAGEIITWNDISP